VEVLPWVFSSGWASGINGYAVVVLLGLAGRLFGMDDVPPALQRTDVLVVAAVLLLMDVVVDKIPYLDSGWDSVHTVIRPVIGATLGALLAGESGSLVQIAAGATGGITALVSHLVKAGLRAAVNTSPEPASNLVVSTGEDLAVAGVVTLSLMHPLAAAIVAAVLLVTGIVLVALAWTTIRKGLRRARRRRAARAAPI